MTPARLPALVLIVALGLVSGVVEATVSAAKVPPKTQPKGPGGGTFYGEAFTFPARFDDLLSGEPRRIAFAKAHKLFAVTHSNPPVTTKKAAEFWPVGPATFTLVPSSFYGSPRYPSDCPKSIGATPVSCYTIRIEATFAVQHPEHWQEGDVPTWQGLVLTETSSPASVDRAERMEPSPRRPTLWKADSTTVGFIAFPGTAGVRGMREIAIRVYPLTPVPPCSASAGWVEQPDPRAVLAPRKRTGPTNFDEAVKYFKALYGREGDLLLDAFRAAGGVWEFGDVAGDVDVDVFFTDKTKIQIEEDEDPLKAAELMREGLEQALPYYGHELIGRLKNPAAVDALLRWNKARAFEAAQLSATLAEIYLAGVVNEGGDWVFIFHELSEGNYLAALALLPFVSSGTIKLVTKTGATIKLVRKGTRKIDDICRLAASQTPKIIRKYGPGEGVSALTLRRLQHGTRHLEEAGLLPKWSHKKSPAIIRQKLVPILENPSATFDHTLGGVPVDGFIGKVDGKTVAVMVFKSGPYKGELATSVVPKAQQLSNWGVK